jgi:HTH-type transcriptional regulator/antitoxin HipB
MSDPYQILAEAIKRERKLNNLTQTDLAHLSKTGINFISQLERGKETLRLSSLLSVMRVLGLEFHIQRGKGSISQSAKLVGRDEAK